MPVTVQRRPGPPTKITAGTSVGAFNGNVVRFRQESALHTAPLYPAVLQVTTCLSDETRTGVSAHLTGPDARRLGEALVEWADAVEA